MAAEHRRITAHVHALESRRLFTGGGTVPTFNAGAPLATVAFHGAATDTATVLQLLTDTAGQSYVVAHVGDTVQIRRLARDGSADTAFAGNGNLTVAASSKLSKAVAPAASMSHSIPPTGFTFCSATTSRDTRPAANSTRPLVNPAPSRSNVSPARFAAADNGAYTLQWLAGTVTASDATKNVRIAIGTVNVAIA